MGKFILSACDVCLVLTVLQTDVAASANAHLDDGVTQQQPSVVPPRRPFSSTPKLDEDARRRSEAATQQLMQNYNGPPNVGIRLMSKMGYGVAGRRLHCLIMAPAILWLQCQSTCSDCHIQTHAYQPEICSLLTSHQWSRPRSMSVFSTTVTDNYMFLFY